MPHKGPHISIAPDFVVNRILRINLEDFADWPESVRHLATEIAEELFLVAYNPFVDPATVKASVKERFEREVFASLTTMRIPSAKASPCSGAGMS